MSSTPFQYQLPQVFKRLINQQNQVAKHLIALREKKKYRLDQQCVVVQGMKTIKELRDKGFQFNTIAITAIKNPRVEDDIKYPALEILKYPENFPAKEYYVADINLARRILGTSSKPGNHEIFAEVPIPTSDEKDLNSKDRLLVFDRINDPGNLGTLVRTANALGWDSGLITSDSCDMYNDKTIRASRALSLTWKHKQVSKEEGISFLKENGFTPVVADMLPSNQDIWSPEFGNDINKARPGTGVWFWNFQNKPKEVPKKIALILSSEHNGVEGLDNELRVSIPMNSAVESLNVANAGGIIMNELNRYIS
jgi:TrmH family RNA methyltransferase